MTLYYINPMSYLNSALYDYNLLSNLSDDIKVTFFGNVQYDAGAIPTAVFKPSFDYQQRKGTVGKALSYACSLLRVMAKCLWQKPDVVHIQWIKFPSLDTFFLRMLRLRDIRVVYTAHNVLPHADIQRKQQKAFVRYYHLLSAIIVHSDTTRKELTAQFGIADEKISVIPHGLIKISYDPGKVAHWAGRLREQHHGKIIFTTLGQQKYYKGVHLLTQLWSEDPAISHNDRIHLIIAGRQYAGVDTTPLTGNKNVTILNRYIDDDEYIALSRATDVMLMPYLRISQSGVLISAINEHVPILVSNVGGLPEPLTIAPIGWNMGEPTSENLRKAILDIASHPEAIEAIKRDDAAWQRLADAYSWKQIGEKTTKLYSKL